jgi:hypothetical protein
LDHIGGGLAPWNEAGYQLRRDGSRLSVDGQPVIFYHFQSLAIYVATSLFRLFPMQWGQLTDDPIPLVWTRRHRVSPGVHEFLWRPYLEQLAHAIADVCDWKPAYREAIGSLTCTNLVAQLTGQFRLRAYEAGAFLPDRLRTRLSPRTRLTG